MRVIIDTNKYTLYNGFRKGCDIMEKIFDNYKGLIFFYLIIFLLTIFWVKRLKTINTQASIEVTSIIETERA